MVLERLFRVVLAFVVFAALLLVAPVPALATGACTSDETTLCLNNGRFKVEVQWRDFQGNTGVGHATILTGDTGYFWFFTNNNVELVVKVLDARGVNGHFWVFYGALSNVEYQISVTDTATGAMRPYANPSGQFASVGDTLAFPDAGSSAVDSADRSVELAALAAPSSGACTPDATSLCLADGRFRVEVNWKDFQGRTGRGQSKGLTADTGYFWFFNSANVELVVKVLDARALNGHFWVFYGALSSVEYEIVVIDTATGETKRYTNPSGTFASAGDTKAFPLDAGTPFVPVTDVGEQIGPDASASIGPAGGTLSSTDGRMTVTVPPNALTSTVDLMVEEIRNFAPGGLGDAYRLEPSGQTFAIPVDITFRYGDADLAGTVADALAVGYQDAQNSWRTINAARLDQAGRTLTASSTHFSDWSLTSTLRLQPSSALVLVGKSLSLSLVECRPIESGDGMTKQLTQCQPYTGTSTLSGWAVNQISGGNGTIGTVVGAGTVGATYTAPASVPTPDEVTATAQLAGVAQGTLQSRIKIVTDLRTDKFEGIATGRFGPAHFIGRIYWTVDAKNDGVYTYRATDGFVFYHFDGCKITPREGTVSSTSFMVINYNTDPPTYDGIAGAQWSAVFDCPPDPAIESLASMLMFDAAGVVKYEGANLDISGGPQASRDGVWTLDWAFNSVDTRLPP